ALKDAYLTVIGVSASGGAREDLNLMVRTVCQAQPERYLARGVQNAVERAFVSGVRRLQWQRLTVKRHGFAAVDGFLRRRRIQSFLADIRLDPALIDIGACVRRGESALTDPSRPTAAQASAAPAADAIEVDAEVQTAIDAGWVTTEEVQQRLQQAQTEAVQLLDSMRLIGRPYDQLLKHLVRHRGHVLGDGDDDRTPLLAGFTEKLVLLDQAVAAIEGKDAELRLLTLRLPPYDDLGELPTDANAISVEESFVDALRGPASELATREAEGRELALLLAALLSASPLRLKIRLLMANRQLDEATSEVESCYARDATPDTARQLAQALVGRRLEQLRLNASLEERSALHKRAEGLVMSVEQRWLATRPDAAEDGQNAADPEADPAAEEAVDDLSDYEKRNGSLFTTVNIRVGMRRSQVASAVIPDPDQQGRMVMAERDPESGRLVPQMARNRRRFVEQQPDGTWQTLT
ncbi:MAG: hypothetical protein HOH74_07395, partial [Gemmatimonadetes bacterium]|nr:hypothetical protein [Gemmatimonadota bacterium]